MDEPGFSILKYHRRLPILAGCKLCRVKFFTGSHMAGTVVRAEKYLVENFRIHGCAPQLRERRNGAIS
jgi:hypothetical protein